MKNLRPKQLLFVGLGLMLLGFMLPLFMIIKLIPAGFFLLFVAWAACVSGMVLGTLGLFQTLSTRRNSD